MTEVDPIEKDMTSFHRNRYSSWVWRARRGHEPDIAVGRRQVEATRYFGPEWAQLDRDLLMLWTPAISAIVRYEWFVMIGAVDLTVWLMPASDGGGTML